MKLMCCVALILALAIVEGRKHYRRDLNQKLDEVKQKFPQKEWDSFYGKLSEALGEGKTEFQNKLEANKGDMDLTLQQFKDKMTNKYPVVQQSWERVKTKYDEVAGKMDQTTLRDVFSAIKGKVTSHTGEIDQRRVDELWNNAKTQLLTFWNRLVQYANQQGA